MNTPEIAAATVNEDATRPTREFGKAATPRSSHRLRRGVWLSLPVAIVAAAIWSMRGTEEVAPGPLPVVAELPDFALTERSGRAVTKADLRGTVWVADFIFTTCAGPCPELTLRLSSLCTALADLGDGVKCVSLSVDPLYDRPEILAKYAARYHANPDRWWFLTADDESEMHELVTAGFLQALSPRKGGSPIIHSTRFVLIDRLGRIRGWHDGLDPGSKRRIVADVKHLLAEPALP